MMEYFGSSDRTVHHRKMLGTTGALFYYTVEDCYKDYSLRKIDTGYVLALWLQRLAMNQRICVWEESRLQKTAAVLNA